MNTWDSRGYLEHAAFVPALGADVLAMLDPRPREQILDLGCGEGTLTARIAEAGATVVGVDTSPAMVAAARARGLDVREVSATALTFHEEFDAVFSNAALHWIADADAVLNGVRRALRPGGRFVAECGGLGNVAAIHVAVRAVLSARRLPPAGRRFYPTASDYRARLERHAFIVDSIALIPRPTPLPTGMRGWLETFERATLDRVPASERAAVVDDIEELLRPTLCDTQGNWTADYVRLRFKATKPDVASSPR